MVTERVEVVVTERGSRVVRRSMEDIGTAARRTDDAVTLLRRSLGLIASYAGLNEIRRLIDTYTNLQNRLRQVTNGTGNLAAVTNELFEIANRTRSAYEGTATLYGRVALATKELGISQRELLTFTERVNQAIILSGANAQEASAGLIQFSQGLASGTLRGDELRSVLEQLPAVADVIAKHLKVTRGELRQMGADGKITTDIILAAFREADYITAQFAKTVPTLGQAFQVAGNQFMRFLGQLDESLGVTRSLSGLVITLTSDMDRLSAAVLGLAGAVAVLAGPAALGALIKALRLVNALVMRNPIGLIAAGVTAAIIALGQLDDTMDETLKKLGYVATAGDKLAATWQGVLAYIKSAWENFPQWLAGIIIDAINGAIRATVSGMNKIAEAIAQAMGRSDSFTPIDIDSLNLLPRPEIFAEAGEKAAAAYRTAYNETMLKIAQGSDTTGLGDSGGGGRRPPSPDLSKELKKLQRELDRVIDRADPTAGAWIELAKAQDVLEKSLARGLITLDQYNALNAQVYRSLEDQLFPIQAYIKDLRKQQQLLSLDQQARERGNTLYQLETQLRRDLTDAEREQLDIELKLTQLRQLEAETLDKIKGPQQQYYQQLDALLNLLGSGAISEKEYQLGLYQSELEYLQAYPSVANEYRAQSLQITEQQRQLTEALDAGTISLDQFNARMAQTAVQAAELRLAMGGDSVGDVFVASLGTLVEGFEGVAASVTDILGDLWSNLSSGLGDAIGQAIVYAESFGDAIKDVARNAVSQLISALVQLGIQWVATQVLAGSLTAASTAATASVAATTAAAWAPAAALASLATMGSNAAPAQLALVSTTALSKALSMPGFADGGWTGDVARNAIAGLVHGQEFVVNAEAAARNRPILEAMNRGDDISELGGDSGGWSGNFYLINESGIELEGQANYTTAGDVEVIVRRRVQELAPTVIARDLDDPTSATRRSLARNTNIQAKRNGNA